MYHKGEADSGTVPVDGTEYSEGDTLWICYNTGNLVREGYMFAGWQSASYAYTFEPGYTYSIYNDMDFYPVWVADDPAGYHVTYHDTDAESGTVPSDTTTYASGDTVTVLGNPGYLTRTDYTLAGWRNNATSTDYTFNGTFSIASDVDLYPIWTWVGGGGGSSGHSYADTTEAFTALGQGLVAAAMTTDSSATAYYVSDFSGSPTTITYYLNGYTYDGITLNGSLTYSTNTTTFDIDETGTVYVSGCDVSAIIYNIHSSGGVLSGTYGYEFTDGTSWIYDCSDGSFTEH